jgi:hypothetical protein
MGKSLEKREGFSAFLYEMGCRGREMIGVERWGMEGEEFLSLITLYIYIYI